MARTIGNIGKIICAATLCSVLAGCDEKEKPSAQTKAASQSSHESARAEMIDRVKSEAYARGIADYVMKNGSVSNPNTTNDSLAPVKYTLITSFGGNEYTVEVADANADGTIGDSDTLKIIKGDFSLNIRDVGIKGELKQSTDTAAGLGVAFGGDKMSLEDLNDANQRYGKLLKNIYLTFY